MARCQLGRGRHRIQRRGAGGSRRGDDGARTEPRCAIALERRRQCVGAQGVRVVGGHEPQVFLAEAGEQRRLLDRAVRLVGGVDDERRGAVLQSLATLRVVGGALARAQKRA